MRNQPLTGYLLHHKPYQEKRALYYFFSQTHGVVHGVGKKGMPLFKPIQLFATGKRLLKNFSQIQPLALESLQLDVVNYQPTGQNLYAGFYLNEILWRLLANEDVSLEIWQAYQQSLQILSQPLLINELKLLLRQFEYTLFNELGYSIDYGVDNHSDPINSETSYQFLVDEGFTIVGIDNKQDALFFRGEYLQAIEYYLNAYQNCDITINNDTLIIWSRLHKHMIDLLLDYKPLKSRELWQQAHRYQQS